jgi:hypothetical protein
MPMFQMRTSLQYAVRQLREDLREAKINAEDREKELLEQIEQLRGQELTDTVS